MQQVVLATNNTHKLHEFRLLLADVDVEFLSPTDVGVSADFDVAETGTSFAQNAELKARAYAQEAGLPALADDSGLIVDALGGLPGVHSKRWIPGSDHDRNIYLLKQLMLTRQQTGKNSRIARFVTVLALSWPTAKNMSAPLKPTIYFEGVVEGVIATAEAGTAGFGYDPLFIPDGQTQTFAQLGDTIKSQLSHRSRAVDGLKQFLMKNRRALITNH